MPDSASTLQAATLPSAADEAHAILDRLGVDRGAWTGGALEARSPITGEVTGQVKTHSADDARAAIERAHLAFLAWRKVPGPQRGELVRLLGEELRVA